MQVGIMRRRLGFRCNLWIICVNRSIHSLFGGVLHRCKLEMLMSHSAGSLRNWRWYHSIRWNTWITSNNWRISFRILRPFLGWRIYEFINRKWRKNCRSISSIYSFSLATKCLIHSPLKHLKRYFKIVSSNAITN